MAGWRVAGWQVRSGSFPLRPCHPRPLSPKIDHRINRQKLNADKTRFDPRPVGVLLAFRFRDCSRPRLACSERTPSMTRCQYLSQRFLDIAPRSRPNRGKSIARRALGPPFPSTRDSRLTTTLVLLPSPSTCSRIDTIAVPHLTAVSFATPYGQTSVREAVPGVGRSERRGLGRNANGTRRVLMAFERRLVYTGGAAASPRSEGCYG